MEKGERFKLQLINVRPNACIWTRGISSMKKESRGNTNMGYISRCLHNCSTNSPYIYVMFSNNAQNREGRA